MNLSELRYIVALARERHFGRAADACFVSQPTLSVAVKKLEDELGVQLFERNRHNIRVTPVGERVVEQAHRALEAVESVRQAATDAGIEQHRDNPSMAVLPGMRKSADIKSIGFIKRQTVLLGRRENSETLYYAIAPIRSIARGQQPRAFY